jgi:selenophosphate synthetase-related protein
VIDVALCAREVVIHAHDVLALGYQPIAQVAAQEARASGNENAISSDALHLESLSASGL